MAKIIGLKEKQAALKEIQLSLHSLEPLNAFISSDNPENEYVISFGSQKAKLKCDDKKKINELVQAYKSVIVKRIEAQAQKYEIELDDEDRSLMQ